MRTGRIPLLAGAGVVALIVSLSLAALPATHRPAAIARRHETQRLTQRCNADVSTAPPIEPVTVCATHLCMNGAQWYMNRCEHLQPRDCVLNSRPTRSRQGPWRSLRRRGWTRSGSSTSSLTPACPHRPRTRKQHGCGSTRWSPMRAPLVCTSISTSATTETSSGTTASTRTRTTGRNSSHSSQAGETRRPAMIYAHDPTIATLGISGEPLPVGRHSLFRAGSRSGLHARVFDPAADGVLRAHDRAVEAARRIRAGQSRRARLPQRAGVGHRLESDLRAAHSGPL